MIALYSSINKLYNYCNALLLYKLLTKQHVHTYWLLVMLSFPITFVKGQKEITGIVLNEENKMPVANVRIEEKNSTNSVSTDRNGRYAISSNKDTVYLSVYYNNNNIADVVTRSSQNVNINIPKAGSDTLKMLYTFMSPPTNNRVGGKGQPAAPPAVNTSPPIATNKPDAATQNDVKNSTAPKVEDKPMEPAKEDVKNPSPFSERRPNNSKKTTHKKSKKSKTKIKESRIPKPRYSSKRKIKCPTGF